MLENGGFIGKMHTEAFMEITKTKEGDATVAVVKGRLDSVTAAAFERSIKEIGDAAGTGVTIDFSGVQYVSSAGLRALLAVHKYMVKKGGIVLRGLVPPVMEVFTITGFNKFLSIQA